MPTLAEAESTRTLADPLSGVVAQALDVPQVTVRGLRRLTGGASRETWALEAVRPDGRLERLVLRRDPVDGAGSPAGFAAEAAAMGAAAAAGVPEPIVLDVGDAPEPLGAPYLLMTHVEGETLPRRILRDDAYAGARERLAAQCGDALARIHAVPPAAVGPLAAPDPLEELRVLLDELAPPSPAFELGLRWLAAHRPAPVAPRLVHGDFRNGNLVVGPEGIRAVLDWELVHLGDPAEDLGYLCARAWRFGGPGDVGGFGDRATLFDAYAAAGGTPPDPVRVRWWEVRATLRWGLGTLEMGSWHLSGDRPSLELAAIGRRAREQEHDLLCLLAEEVGR